MQKTSGQSVAQAMGQGAEGETVFWLYSCQKSVKKGRPAPFSCHEDSIKSIVRMCFWFISLNSNEHLWGAALHTLVHSLLETVTRRPVSVRSSLLLSCFQVLKVSCFLAAFLFQVCFPLVLTCCLSQKFLNLWICFVLRVFKMTD